RSLPRPVPERTRNPPTSRLVPLRPANGCHREFALCTKRGTFYFAQVCSTGHTQSSQQCTLILAAIPHPGSRHGGFIVQRIHRFIGSLFLAAAIVAPVVMV